MSNNEKIKIEKITPFSRKITMPILLLTSIIFIAVGIIALNKINNGKQYYRETPAIITLIDSHIEYDETTDGDPTYSKVFEAYVTYTIEDKTYTNVKLPYYDASMKEGQSINIFYDYRNPSKPILDARSSYIIVIIMIVGGVLVGISTIIYSIVIVKQDRQEKDRINKLIHTGIVKRVTIVFIQQNDINLQFFCIFGDREYSSPKVKPNHELYTGCTVNIYFEREGFEERLTKGEYQLNYYMDLDSVEKGEYQPQTNL